MGQGSCTPSIGAVFDVFVAEGCIPQRDYISEMQDTSARVSKQVKIYLRRSVIPVDSGCGAWRVRVRGVSCANCRGARARRSDMYLGHVSGAAVV
jgi:hypothetical protein